MDLFLKSVYGSYIIFRKSRSFHETLYQVLLLYLSATPYRLVPGQLSDFTPVQQRLEGTDQHLPDTTQKETSPLKEFHPNHTWSDHSNLDIYDPDVKTTGATCQQPRLTEWI